MSEIGTIKNQVGRVIESMSETRVKWREMNNTVEDARIKGNNVNPCQNCSARIKDEFKGLCTEYSKFEHNLKAAIETHHEICTCPVEQTDQIQRHEDVPTRDVKGRKKKRGCDSAYESMTSAIFNSMSRGGEESVDECANAKNDDDVETTPTDEMRLLQIGNTEPTSIKPTCSTEVCQISSNSAP